MPNRKKDDEYEDQESEAGSGGGKELRILMCKGGWVTSRRRGSSRCILTFFLNYIFVLEEKGRIFEK